MRGTAANRLYPKSVLSSFRCNLSVNPRCSISVAALLVACLIGNVTGCGTASNAPSGDARAARGVLKVLGVEYGRFMAQHDGRSPVDKEQLVAFLETRKDRITGLKDIEQLFVSPRDNEPLVIYYGKSTPPADDSGFPAVAREATGAAGKCLVANTRGGVQEVPTDQIPPHLGAPQ
jgi:hypothetical protein